MAMVVFSLTMFIGACGGGDDDDDSTTATTARATATTTEQVGNALPRLPEVFAPIPGHTYVELPESVLTDLQDQFASDPDTREAVAAADGRSVTRAGEPVAVIIAVGFDEKSAALPGVEEGFVAGATEDAVPGTKKTLNLSGEEATFGTDDEGAHTIAWLGGTLALVIIGDDEPAITTVATALIAANK
jgi:antitoxin (DNA-binding transcriptional repressor) of toxin-antitoxin stability system